MKSTLAALLVCCLPSCLPCHGQIPPEVRRAADSVSIDNLTTHVRAMERAGGLFSRVRHTAGDDSGVAYISRTFRSLPQLASVVEDTFSLTNRPGSVTRTQTNVIATITGAASPLQVIVVGAHHDCSADRMGSSIWNAQWNTMRAPGADDNATGIAVILELARVMTNPALECRPACTVKLVAFAAEESNPADYTSHAGSRRCAQASRAAGEAIAGMISVDMVGCNPNQFFQSVIANPASSWLADHFAAINDSLRVGLILSRSVTSVTYSDHDSYWNASYPAVCLIENAPPWNSNAYYQANPYYHKTSDTCGTVNFWLVRKVAQLTLAAVNTLAMKTVGVGGQAVTQQPEKAALHQNYPNPFNPTTTINYQLSTINHTRITVFDMLGREVALLVDETKGPGSYSVEWDASGNASGYYVCRMVAGDFVASMKLMLVR